ncbi:MAG TPA: divergent polysaccharide deacetylase family protein [Sulfurospirillum arcachonense]|nr:divergent polysaccharide deacetylase family protein [Sulfurospirillum arcachonense]
MAKNSRKKRKSHKKSGLFSKRKIALILLACFAAFAIVYGVNYFQLIQSKKENQKSTEILMDKMKKMLDEEKKRLDSLLKYKKPKEPKKLPPVTIMKPKEIEKETHLSEIKDYKKSLEKEDIKLTKPLHVDKKVVYSGKPKLAIIIDDVAYVHQTRLIKKIPFRVTPSFFPPTKRHPDTIKLAKDFRFPMIHLPTEALSFGRPEPETLKVGDSIQIMRKRIKQIKKWFPSVKYYNNHTGSKFTADFQSMDRLMGIMKDENLYFVDSRTTASTKAPKVAKKYGLKLYSRDIFIDNSIEKKLIKKQLLKAVAIAKKRGYAVAIGHPHENTLKVLIGAKDMLKDVELVYLKDL